MSAGNIERERESALIHRMKYNSAFRDYSKLRKARLESATAHAGREDLIASSEAVTLERVRALQVADLELAMMPLVIIAR